MTEESTTGKAGEEGSVLSEIEDATVEETASVKAKGFDESDIEVNTKRNINTTAGRKPKCAYKPKFTVKKRSEKLEDNSLSEKYPLCAKLMGNDTTPDAKGAKPAVKIESDVVIDKSNFTSRLVPDSIGRDAGTNLGIFLDISEDIDNPSDDNEANFDRSGGSENVKSPSSKEPTMSEQDES